MNPLQHQILIPSYERDAKFLTFCLVSLRRFARGFLPPVVCVDGADVPLFQRIRDVAYPEADIVRYDGDGYMRAQLAMMRADEICPEADVIHLVGSDCLALREFGPGLYCEGTRPVVLMNSYAHLEKQEEDEDTKRRIVNWRSGVRRMLGICPEYEYMRRLPSVFPRSIFAPMRDRVERVHNREFDSFIATGNIRWDTSEANLLGAFAHRFMPDTCEFVDLDHVTWTYGIPFGWPSAIGQMFSLTGLEQFQFTPFEYEFRGETVRANAKPPRQIIAEVLYDGDERKLDNVVRLAQ